MFVLIQQRLQSCIPDAAHKYLQPDPKSLGVVVEETLMRATGVESY